VETYDCLSVFILWSENWEKVGTFGWLLRKRLLEGWIVRDQIQISEFHGMSTNIDLFTDLVLWLNYTDCRLLMSSRDYLLSGMLPKGAVLVLRDVDMV